MKHIQVQYLPILHFFNTMDSLYNTFMKLLVFFRNIGYILDIIKYKRGRYDMKNYKIAVQQGLNEISDLLSSKGYDVVPFETFKDKVAVTIISGVDSAYEEIEPAQCRNCGGDEEMLVINATRLSPEKVLEYVENIKCC